MKNAIWKNIFVFLLVTGLSLVIIGSNATADIVTDISIDPEEPKPLDQLTITALVTNDEEIDEVVIVIKECKVGLCYKRTPITMDPSDETYTYEAEYELKYSDATYISYHLEVTSGGTMTKTDVINVTLDLESNNGGTNGGGSDSSEDNGSKGIPGFEIFLIIAAVFTLFVFFRKKR